MKVTKDNKENYIVLNEIKSDDDRNNLLLVNAETGKMSFAHGVVENKNGMTYDRMVGFQDEMEKEVIQRERRKKSR